MIFLLKFIAKNYIQRDNSKLNSDMVDLMKFLNKGLNNVEMGINKKLEIEYNNSIV